MCRLKASISLEIFRTTLMVNGSTKSLNELKSCSSLILLSGMQTRCMVKHSIQYPQRRAENRNIHGLRKRDFIFRQAITYRALLWRHDGRGNVSNHQPHDCLLNRLFRRRSKKTSKLRVTGLCVGIPWICYERSFSEFYLFIWNQLVFNQRLQLFVQSPQSY